MREVYKILTFLAAYISIFCKQITSKSYNDATAQTAYLAVKQHQGGVHFLPKNAPLNTLALDIVEPHSNDEYLSAVFSFQVAQKLRQGRPLLDASVPSTVMQESAMSHFVGYFGEAFQDVMKPKLADTVDQCEVSKISAPECAKVIIQEFMREVKSKFTMLDSMDPKVALDRELQVMYAADLTASYVILFCPLKVRHEIYKYLWGHAAFLDGAIDWLCCPWVLNQGKHDAEYHKTAIDMSQVTNSELIDIIRLHKNYLSTDYVKQRSRDALKQLDRRSLLSVFQSVMLRVLWGHESVAEEQQTSTNEESSTLQALDYYSNNDTEEQLVKRNSLSVWIEEYRSKRVKRGEVQYTRPDRLHLKDTEYITQLKKSIDVIKKHLDKFNECFRGVASDTPFAEAAKKQGFETPKGERLRDDITIDNVRTAFKTLLDIYKSNLEINAEIYGHIPNVSALKLLKFMLSYEKHELTAMISAVLMALPEFKPIKSEQEFAQYSMLSFNTLAKLCFIATLRINPSVAHDDLGIEMDDTEIKNNRCIIDADTGSNVSPDSASEVDTSEQIENASLVFTLEELEPVYRFLDSRRYSLLEAQVGNELKNCIVLSSKRTRIITEAILMHRSNYEDVYKSLKGYDIPAPSTGQDDLTTDSIRTYKLAAVIKKMTDDELEKLYTSVIENSTKHKDIDIPDDVYKITSHSLLENIEKGVDDSTVYTKVNEMLGKMLADTTEDGHSTAEYGKENKSEAEDDIDFDPWDTDTDFAVTCDTNSTTSNGQAMSNRQHYLTLLDGMDISQFINDSFSSNNPEDMNDCELEKLCNMVIEHMESSGECTVIHYNPGGKDNSYTSISALPAPTSSKASSKRNNSFVLYAHPEVNTDYDHLQDRCVIDSELEEESYGYGNFPKRVDDTRGFTWQCYDKFPKFTRISNRVSPHGLEEYINDWQALGLKPQIAQAAVAWIRKTLLDAIGKVDQRNLEIIPTDIQTMAIRHLLKHRNDILIASNAASGKTLAYLLPIIQKLKKHETLKLRHPNAPRALVLVPNRELADQILHVVKGLGHVVKISSEIISGGVYKGIQRDDMKRLVDVVVATPDRLLKMKNHVKLHQLQYLVLDEADTLLNEGFWPDVAKVLDLIKQPFQLIQVAASSKYLLHFEKVQRELAKVPNLKGIKNTTREVNDKYLDRLTKCEQIVDTAWVDRPNRGVTHQFHYLKGEDKGLELVNLLKYDDVRRCRKVMVFCNSVSSCRAVEYILRDAGLPATSLHGKIPIMQRRMYYKEFLRSSEGIIVCTDLASRGLDLNADAVIMFDFPLNSMDYLKRAGRVGRMINNDSIAPKGFAISLVKKRDRNLAIAIERSLKMPFFPISNLSRHKKDYNQRSGRLKYLTQAGGYFKLAKLLRQEEIKGTYNYANMGQYLEQFKEIVKEMYARSLKKIVLRRRRICKRRRILTRRLKLMKRYNKAIRLKQRIISMTDRRRRRKKFSMHSPMKGDDRRCPPIKDLKPIRAKILELKLMQDKLTRRLLERNDKYLRKFINKTQLTALALRKSPENEEEVVDRQLPFTIIQKAKDKVGKSIKRICSLI